jgi:hypothetical protein
LCFRRPEIVGAGDGIKLFSLFTAPAEFTQTIVDVIADQFAGDQMKTDRDAPGSLLRSKCSSVATILLSAPGKGRASNIKPTVLLLINRPVAES